tara:strand:+ start:140 stop:679 length:540 start_codon:yes stop_codon:yes gene_type:complete
MASEIYNISNIFSRQKRRKLIKKSKPLCRFNSTTKMWETKDLRFNKDFWDPSLHIISLFEKKLGLKLEIVNLWITYTRGEKLKYHTHPFDWACVYYMKTNSLLRNNGTKFKFSEDDEQLVKSPQNSAILFDGSIPHVTPDFRPLDDRYALTMDLIIVNDDGSYRNFIQLPGPEEHLIRK